jgi:hypothetical protein
METSCDSWDASVCESIDPTKQINDASYHFYQQLAIPRIRVIAQFTLDESNSFPTNVKSEKRKDWCNISRYFTSEMQK